MKNTIFYWSSNNNARSGEGILSKHFLSDLKKFKKSKIIKIPNNYKFENIFVKNYIYPLIGVFKLWIKYLNGNKICYINYLPLWNFLIFLLLPSKVILGPITGTISSERNFFLKKKLEKISKLIIILKFKKCLFANNFYKDYFNEHYHNYIISELKFKRTKNKKKKFDLIIYYRKNYDQKKNLYNLVTYLSQKKFKIVVIADKIKSKDIINLGYINENQLNLILKKTRCAIANKENLYSYFTQNCLSKNLKVFYNKEFKKLEKFKLNNFYSIPYDNVRGAYKIIKKKQTLSIKLNKNIKLNFNDYFKNV